MGVDLFFNIPRHDNPVIYEYHIINVPVKYFTPAREQHVAQHLECNADWMGQMKLFLDKGWKLVDICMDTTTLAHGQ